MSVAQPEATDEESSNLPWFVYDRHLHLLHTAGSLSDAEAWAIGHWGIVEVADRQQLDDHDYWYLLLAAPQESGFCRVTTRRGSCAKTGLRPWAGTRKPCRATRRNSAATCAARP